MAMKKRTRTCDIRCMDLAEHFTSHAPDEYSEADLYDLACDIQQAVEDWFADRQRIAFEQSSAVGS